MNTPGLVTATILGVFAVAHAWLGERWLLPRLFALPRLPESFYFKPTSRLRFMCRVAWLLGSLAWLWLAVLMSSTWWLNLAHARELVFVPIILTFASPLIVGAYLGALLKPRLGTPNLGRAILLWAVLLLVMGGAWFAAQ